jgi:sporulation protein YlmC with PRC-barrel domain
MREKLFVNLGLNAEIMELVFNIKKGRISHLKFLNDENKLVGK